MKKENKELYMYILGAIIVIAFFATIYLLAKVEMPLTNKDLLLIVIGALVAKFGDVVAYFFGSSKGSADKNEMLGGNNG
jgi:CDP-diglyceride synthetase